jgi:multidrug efflux system outer membrane protein
MRTSFHIGIAVAAVTLAGCTVSPNYKRPQIDVPASFRAPEPLPESQGASLADLKWFEVFRDPQLDDLIKVALVQNYDLRDAVARVDEARASLNFRGKP